MNTNESIIETGHVCIAHQAPQLTAAGNFTEPAQIVLVHMLIVVACGRQAVQ